MCWLLIIWNKVHNNNKHIICPFNIWRSKVQLAKAHVANANYKYWTKFLYTNVNRTFLATISILDKTIALKHNLTPIYATKWTRQIFMLENTSSQTTLNYPISLYVCHGFFKWINSKERPWDDVKCYMWPLIGWFSIKWTLRQLVASFAYFLNIILCSHPYVFFYGCYAIDFVITKYTKSRHKLLKYKV